MSSSTRKKREVAELKVETEEKIFIVLFLLGGGCFCLSGAWQMK